MSVQKNTGKAGLESPRLQWDDIRYFLELARTGSLSGAARKLCVEHSTVARRVEALEQSLGLRLFDRLPKGWTLTAEGDALARQATCLDAEAQAFSRAAAGISSLSGTVRLSAPPVLASHLLVPRLSAMRAQWPNIDLEVMGESRDASLSRGEADLAIRMSRPTASGLAARRVGEMGYGLYAVSGYQERPESEWEFLGYDEHLSQVPQQRWLKQFAGERRFVFRSNDLAALLPAAKAGLGVAVLPCFLAAQDPALRLISNHVCPIVRPLWLVMHPDVRRSPRVRLIAEMVADLIGKTSELSSDTSASVAE
ncbi:MULTISPECIES: LysR family transcriptional regulator [unclassified Paraburkholderia]|uniref:LysR family transcriptional regulator n=1 Tax=unclassified Paraburkholderia TaxID=2615204 RepID=UPI002AAFCD5A|nr:MULTISPECIES: LysR family transcriptional regulator [unclassified Paraburkholderia]